MRVLYLTMNPNRASTTVPTEGWFNLLRPRGLDPVLVSSRSGRFQQWAREQGVPSYDMALPYPNMRNPVPFVRALTALTRIARRHDIGLVHCNEHDVYPMGQYVARLLGLPKLASVHCEIDRGFGAWAFGGRREPDRLLFVSRSNQEACRPAVDGVVPEQRWRVLRNGLDLQRFKPDVQLREQTRQAYGVDGVVTIGVACALRPLKQLEHLFQAAAAIDRPVRVLVAGGPIAGDEAYAEKLLAEARVLLGSRLQTLGHLDDLRGFFNALDLFVNTSQQEACSISVIESLSSGCPVVGYPSLSVDEQVLPSGGEIVPQGDVAALAAALTRWVGDAARLTAAREGARRQAEALFDIRKLSNDLWSHYEQVMDEHAGVERRRTA